MVAMAATFVGGAAAQVQDADRSIEDAELAPGDSTIVTVEVTMEETDEPDIIDEFDPAFADAELVDADPLPTLQDVGEDSVLIFWDEVDAGETATVQYEVTVPEDAEDGDTFEFSGAADSADGDAVDIAGDDTITVVADDEDDDDDEVDEPEPTDPVEDDEFDVEYDRTNLEGQIVFQGQHVAVTGFDAQERVQLRAGNAQDGPFGFQENLRADDDGTVVVDTSDYDGFLLLRGAGGSGDNYGPFEIAEQRVEFEFAGDQVAAGGATDLVFEDDNRGDEVDLHVTADELDYEDVADVFDADVDDDEEVAVIQDAEEGDELAANFEDVAAGDYEFTVSVSDTTAEDTASISVLEAVDADAEFAEGIVTQERGDLAAITVELEGTSAANLSIGSEEAGYEADLTVEDGEGDGEVTVYWNTYLAGTGDDATFWTGDNDDAVTFQQEADHVDLEGGDAGDLILAGSYEMDVTPVELDDLTDLGSVEIQQRSTDSINTWTAPDGATDGVADMDDVADLVEDGLVTETDQIADGDVLITEIEASGLNGAGFLANDQVSLVYEQTNPQQNRSPKVFNADSDDVDVISTPMADTYYVVVDMDDADFVRQASGDAVDLSAGDNIETQFVVGAGDEENLESYSYGLVAPSDGVFEDEVLVDGYDFVDAAVSIDNGDLTVQPVAGELITGDSTLAPGTEIDVRIQTLREQPSQFVDSFDATVDADRNWEFETDIFEDRIPETQFRVTVTSPSVDNPGSTVEGEIIDPEDPHFAVSDLSPEDATVDQGDLIDVSATVTNDGGQEDTQEIVLDIDGDEVDSQEVTLDEGDSETVEFTDVDTAGLDAGTYTHTVSSDDESASGSLTVDVDEPAEFTVSGLDPADAEFDEDDGALDSLTVSATIENVGDLEGTQSITLDIDGDDVASEELTLAGGDSATVELTADASGLAPGTYTHTVSSEDDSASGSLTIAEVEEDDDDPPEEDDDDPPAEDDDDEPEDPDDDGPGFGIAAALIAFIGAALLAVRRQN